MKQQRGSERGPNLRSIVLASMRKALKWPYHRSDGYWNYNHMVLQLEDCVDVLNHLHGSDYDYLFLFDQLHKNRDTLAHFQEH
mmetsp:Transcript_9241/g.13411  ORF Transcript_9241/g.13411 Transcript_9241/m.13411 type:complete len:83 (-) Transcript_9241:600-848(-)